MGVMGLLLTLLLPWRTFTGTVVWGHLLLCGSGFSQLHKIKICIKEDTKGRKEGMRGREGGRKG